LIEYSHIVCQFKFPFLIYETQEAKKLEGKVFVIENASRKYILAADTRQDLESWLNVLRRPAGMPSTRLTAGYTRTASASQPVPASTSSLTQPAVAASVGTDTADLHAQVQAAVQAQVAAARPKLQVGTRASVRLPASVGKAPVVGSAPTVGLAPTPAKRAGLAPTAARSNRYASIRLEAGQTPDFSGMASPATDLPPAASQPSQPSQPPAPLSKQAASELDDILQDLESDLGPARIRVPGRQPTVSAQGSRGTVSIARVQRRPMEPQSDSAPAQPAQPMDIDAPALRDFRISVAPPSTSAPFPPAQPMETDASERRDFRISVPPPNVSAPPPPVEPMDTDTGESRDFRISVSPPKSSAPPPPVFEQSSPARDFRISVPPPTGAAPPPPAEPMDDLLMDEADGAGRSSLMVASALAARRPSGEHRRSAEESLPPPPPTLVRADPPPLGGEELEAEELGPPPTALFQQNPAAAVLQEADSRSSMDLEGEGEGRPVFSSAISMSSHKPSAGRASLLSRLGRQPQKAASEPDSAVDPPTPSVEVTASPAAERLSMEVASSLPSEGYPARFACCHTSVSSLCSSSCVHRILSCVESHRLRIGRSASGTRMRIGLRPPLERQESDASSWGSSPSTQPTLFDPRSPRGHEGDAGKAEEGGRRARARSREAIRLKSGLDPLDPAAFGLDIDPASELDLGTPSLVPLTAALAIPGASEQLDLGTPSLGPRTSRLSVPAAEPKLDLGTPSIGPRIAGTYALTFAHRSRVVCRHRSCVIGQPLTARQQPTGARTAGDAGPPWHRLASSGRICLSSARLSSLCCSSHSMVRIYGLT
jgi:hypothetical protein